MTFINLKSNSSSKISSFKLKSIYDSNENGKINREYISKINFYANYEKNFQIMLDEKTIVGVEFGKNNKVLIMEEIEDPNSEPYKFGSHQNNISCIIPNQDFTSICVGDSSGKIIQYNLNTLKKTWSLVKDYGNIAIGPIFSGKRMGNLIFFGGNNYLIRAIEMAKKEMFFGPFKTAVNQIYSLQFCKISSSNIGLFVFGLNRTYSAGLSDILDINGISKFYNMKTFKNKLSINWKNLYKNHLIPKNFKYQSNEKINHVLSQVEVFIQNTFDIFIKNIEEHGDESNNGKIIYINNY